MRVISLVVVAAAILGHSAAATAQAPPAAPLPPAVVANQHFKDGMLAYLDHDYKKAIPALKTAMDELRGTDGFETSTAWRVLVDNLGMAQGVTGDLKGAKGTFDYGVSRDPAYPLFHYNLACVLAESKDRDGAIGELRQAFALKANGIPGEPLPNPARDDSFTRFMKDKTFVAALEEIRKAGRMFPDRLDFTVANAPWVLTIPAGDFDVAANEVPPGGVRGRFLFTSDKTGLTASITIEPAVKCTDSKSCRDFVRTSDLPRVPGPKDVSSSEIGDISVFEYLLPEFRGVPVRQQNLYAEFVQDGFWIDLHISKAGYDKKDRKLFEALVSAVAFERKK